MSQAIQTTHENFGVLLFEIIKQKDLNLVKRSSKPTQINGSRKVSK